MSDTQRTKDRNWVIEEPFFVDADDGDELLDSILEAVTILRRIGGGVTIVADRAENTDGMYETVRYWFAWRSYAPARKKPEPVREPEPVESAAA